MFHYQNKVIMRNISINIPMENRHISSSLMEKILSEKDNGLVQEFFRIYRKEATGKGIKNVTVNNKGEMTFLPKGKECVVDTASFPNVWKKDNRQSGSYGKVLRKLLVENGVDPKAIIASELERIVNSLKARYTVEGEFVIVDGSDITKYYLQTNYDHGFNLGSMGSSCMRYGGACQKATEFYAENDNCEMVILKSPNSDRSRGRALLWTDVNGRKFLDRIYANDHITEAFKMFARSNGWYHKLNQDPCNGYWVDPNGMKREIHVDIEVNTDFSPRPYMDTFYYWNKDEIMNYDHNGYDVYVQSEPNDEDDDSTTYDDIDNDYIDYDDAVWIQNRGINTHYNNAIKCTISDEWYLEEDTIDCEGDRVFKEAEGIVYVPSEDCYYYEENVSFCDFNAEYYPEDEVSYIYDLGIDVHEDDVDRAYKAAGWVFDEDDETWVEVQKELF